MAPFTVYNALNNTIIISNKKPVFTPSESIKKLLKTVKKIFKKTSSKPKASVAAVPAYCMTEEEHQNWLNEQLE